MLKSRLPKAESKDMDTEKYFHLMAAVNKWKLPMVPQQQMPQEIL